MTTEKQIEANRENAKKGGVKTEEGKAISSRNALRHGILARHVIIESEHYKENRAALSRVVEDFVAELQPKGVAEEMLVERIATTYWRLRRVIEAENDVLVGKGDFMPFGRQVYLATDRAQNVTRYEAHLDRCMYRAIHELQRLQAARFSGQPVPAPLAIEVNQSLGEH